jgi:2-polyprenyl-6-methoxyphenol hydroxylase-like FAD-dependent oxidoreductase
VSLLFAPDGMVVIAPMPDGVFRVVASLDNAPAEPTLADIQALLAARGPRARPLRVLDVTWSSRFRLHHRLATSYRSGRTLVMGDAAHVHSPAGGQGMNTGLIDAVVLGELLAQIVQGQRSEREIELYEQLRRPAAAQVLELAQSLTRLATVRGAVRRRLRNAWLALMNRLPWFGRRLVLRLSGLSRAELARLPPPAPSGAAAGPACPRRPLARAAALR